MCCGKGVCEIKCPESIKDQAPSVENVKYIKLENDALSLDQNQPYYYQVQGQMKILDRKYSLSIHTYIHILFSLREENRLVEGTVGQGKDGMSNVGKSKKIFGEIIQNLVIFGN